MEKEPERSWLSSLVVFAAFVAFVAFVASIAFIANELGPVRPDRT